MSKSDTYLISFSRDYIWISGLVGKGNFNLTIEDPSTPCIWLPQNRVVFESGCIQDHLLVAPPIPGIGPPCVHHGMKFSISLDGRSKMEKY